MNSSTRVHGPHSLRNKPRVLIVDDDAETSDQLSTLLDGGGYACKRAASGLEALLAVAQQPFDVVVSDIKMEGMSGLDLLDEIVTVYPRLPVIVCTGFSAIAGAVDATKRGAYQYLEKPYDLRELEQAMEAALQDPSTDGEHRPGVSPKVARKVTSPLAPTVAPLLLGTNPAIASLRQSIASVAASRAPVLITGESGTGKDLVARAGHAGGSRCTQAFVAVNVSAIPEHLLESELFGHVRGAFTGASEARRGLILEAHNGTLFLDEIGDMPIGLQAKLLRVLQFGELRPVGSDHVRHVDVRIITATHRDLLTLIEKGQFREDLYFRIHVLPIWVPPLRERRSDIVALARHFLQGARQRTPTSPRARLRRRRGTNVEKRSVAREHSRAPEHRRTSRRLWARSDSSRRRSRLSLAAAGDNRRAPSGAHLVA